MLEELKKHDEELPVLMITAYASMETRDRAMKQGAFDYITKPFKNDEVLVVLRNAIERRRLRGRETRAARRTCRRATTSSPGSSASSPRMKQVFDLIIQAAPSRSTILITGESGTGKELVARAIHVNSSRSDKSFVTVNSGNLPPDLLESTLFGHVKGAFTGAVYPKKGLFELADKGSIFFDEIGNIPIETQAKLLRVMQEREFMRLGGMETIKVDVRIIAATNVDLKREMEDGRFREDLFYRLHVISIELPPLRERRDDIPLLVQHFLEKYGEENERPRHRTGARGARPADGYDWPGNVRELENVIERAVVLSTGTRIGAGPHPGARPQGAALPAAARRDAGRRRVAEGSDGRLRAHPRAGGGRGRARERPARRARSLGRRRAAAPLGPGPPCRRARLRRGAARSARRCSPSRPRSTTSVVSCSPRGMRSRATSPGIADPVARSEDEKGGVLLRPILDAVDTARVESTPAFTPAREHWFDRLLGPERGRRAALGARRVDPPAVPARGDVHEGARHSGLSRDARRLGFDLAAERGIRIDLDDRPQKSPRACVIASDPPRVVHLITRAQGGLADYEAFLHEAGHALHYAGCEPALPFAFRRLSRDHALTEIYSFLVDSIAREAGWHAEYFELGTARREERRARRASSNTLLFRRYAAKLGYELDFWPGFADGGRARRRATRGALSAATASVIRSEPPRRHGRGVLLGRLSARVDPGRAGGRVPPAGGRPRLVAERGDRRAAPRPLPRGHAADDRRGRRANRLRPAGHGAARRRPRRLNPQTPNIARRAPPTSAARRTS